MERARLERKARNMIRKEYFKFRRTTLIYATKPDIWLSASKIAFWDSVKEYFECKEDIPETYLRLAVIEPTLLQIMWQIYLKDQYLDFWTWEGIEEILEKVLLKWKVTQCA